MSESELKNEVVELFNELDKDGNGELDRQELFDFFIKKFEEKMTPELLKLLTDSFDENFDGKISLEEFKTKIKNVNFGPSDVVISKHESLLAQGADKEMPVTLFREAITEESKGRFIDLFKRADTDGNGTLSREEVAVLLKQEFGNYDASVDKAFILADNNKDDKLDLDEFLSLWNYDLVKQLLNLKI